MRYDIELELSVKLLAIITLLKHVRAILSTKAEAGYLLIQKDYQLCYTIDTMKTN